MIWLRAAREWIGAYLPLIALIVVSFAIAFAWVQVQQWRADSHELATLKPKLTDAQDELEQIKAEREAAATAYAAAAATAHDIAEADRLAAKEVQRDLESKLATADRAGRDLARRLRDFQARAGRGALPGLAGAAAGAADAASQPDHGQVVELATAEHFGACAGDAERLAHWGEWYGRVCRNWRDRGLPVEGECP